MRINNLKKRSLFLNSFLMPVVSIWLLGVTTAYTQGQWAKTNGPYGYTTSAIASVNSKRIFAATLEAGLFRSTDQGATWQQINNGLNGYIPFYSLAIDSSGNVYAGTYDGHVFKTIDYGATWAQMSDWGHYFVLCLSVNSHGNIYAGIGSTNVTQEGGLYVSTNGGNSWNEDTTWLNWAVYNICFDAFDRVYMATNFGFFRSLSSDINPTWVQYSDVATDQCCVYVGSNGDVYYADQNYFVSHSTDGGDTWRDNSLQGQIITCITGADSGVVYAGSADGHLWKSTDFGHSWDSLYLNGMTTRIRSLIQIPKGPLMIATGGDGILKSYDGGQTWIEGGIKPVQPTQLLADSTGTIYAVRPDNIISRTTDQGEHWRRVSNATFNSLTKTDKNTFMYAISCIVREPADGAAYDTLCFSGYISAYQCYNPCPGSNSSVTAENLISSQDGYIYMYGMINSTSCSFTHPYGVGYSNPALTIKRSTNDGLDWKEIKSAPCYSSPLYFSCNSGGWVFDISTDSTASVSSDNGNTWNDLSGKFSSIVGTPAMGLYAVDGTGNIVYSSDFGVNWSVSAGLNIFHIQATSLLLGPNNVLLAGTKQGKVLYSRTGSLWDTLSGTLPPESVGTLAVDSAGHVWAALPDGVYRWSNSITDVHESALTPLSEDMVLYPNPASEATTVDIPLPQTGATEIRLYDMLGRNVFRLSGPTIRTGAFHAMIPVNSLAPGLYTCRTRVGNKLFVNPLVVTR
jgi:photosystem II stability/assembly factor-like uncharacterized protein